MNKLILPELTRVLKYRCKASALSSAGDRLDTISQRGQEETSNGLSRPVGKSGSSALYQYAISSSARVLTEARKKKETFLNGVTSGKAVDATSLSGKRSNSTSSPSGAGFSSQSSTADSASKSTKSGSTLPPQGDRKAKSFSKQDSKKQDKSSLSSENSKSYPKPSSKTSKTPSKNSPKGSKGVKGEDGSKS